MRLYELFTPHSSSMSKELKNAILDILTPLAAHGSKEVSIDTVVDRLKLQDFGLEVTADVVKDCVDPNKIPFVTDIDDTTIYMNGGAKPEEAQEPEMGEPPVDPIQSSARKQATADLNPKKPPVPPM